MNLQLAEEGIQTYVQWIRLAVETTGATLVAVGFTLALVGFILGRVSGNSAEFSSVRLTLARYLALALEFQLGADILSTAVAPTWDQIGKLAAIAVIRTGLNYFLALEIRRETAGGQNL